MSLQKSSSLDEFYGIESCVEKRPGKQNTPLNYAKENSCDITEEVSSQICQVNSPTLHLTMVKLGSSEVIKVDYEESHTLEYEHSPTSFHSEQDSSYYEELDFDTSVKSDTPVNLNMSQISLDSNDHIKDTLDAEYSESDSVPSPIEPQKERILSVPLKRKIVDVTKRKLRTVGPRKPFARVKQQGRVKATAKVPDTDFVSQNVLAARKLKINDLRNEIADLQRQYKNLDQENKVLRRINNRQQRELSKIEESRSVLPELIKAHTEEIRVMKSLLKQSRDKYRELECRMKSKDTELEKKKQELQKMKYLSKDKDLMERNELHQKNESLESIVKGKHQAIVDLNRKLELLEKCYRRDITAEKARQKEILKEMNDLQLEYDKLQCSLAIKERKIEQQNMYCNSRKTTANISHLVDMISPKSKNFVKQDVSPKQSKVSKSPLNTAEHVTPKQERTEISDARGKPFSTPARKYADFELEFQKIFHSEAPRRRRTSPATDQCKIADNSFVGNSKCEKRFGSETNERFISHNRTMNLKESDLPFSKDQQSKSSPARDSKLIDEKQALGGNEEFQISRYVPSVNGDYTRQSSVRIAQDSGRLTDSKNPQENVFTADSSTSHNFYDREELCFLGNVSNKSQEMPFENKSKRDHGHILSNHDSWLETESLGVSPKTTGPKQNVSYSSSIRAKNVKNQYLAL